MHSIHPICTATTTRSFVGNSMQFKASSLQFQTFLVAKCSNQFTLPSVGVPNVLVYC